MKKTILTSLMITLVLISGCAQQQIQEQVEETKTQETPEKTFKVLHIMSYHSPWKWTDDQLEGFKQAMDDLNVEYRVFQMDTKRKSSEEWKLEATRQAKEIIDTWQPDLVYTNDDNVQEFVVKDYVNTDIPFVFSGVNADPSKYGFRGSSNIAGVLEVPHFVQSVNLLREIAPDTKRIAVVIDEGSTWPAIIDMMKEKAPKELSDIEFISWDTITTFEEYKQKMKEYENTADAVALLGIFTFKDEAGENVPYIDVLKWTAENSNLPDFSYWSDRISHGTLCAMTVSGYEQGLAAGKIARAILAEGKSPSSFPFEATTKGEPVISLARADKLGIQISSDVLLKSEVINTFGWDE